MTTSRRRLDRREALRQCRAVLRATLPLPEPEPEPDRDALRAALDEAWGAGRPDARPDARAEAKAGAEDGLPPRGPVAAEAKSEPRSEPRPEPVPDTTPQSEPKPEPEPDPAAALDAAWGALPVLSLDPRHLERHLVITSRSASPAQGAFDVLRTRVLTEMERRGWRRLGITSPTKGCGKTFTSANLAVTLSRLGALRTLLLDLDLRQPALARVLGAPEPGAIADWLIGRAPPEAALARVRSSALHVSRLAVGLNGRQEPFAAELFREDRMSEALRAAEAWLRPDVTIFDLPPALAQDDVIAMRPHYDAILIVAGGGQTTPRELKETARRLGPDTPILGVVLNKAEGEEVADYAYY